MQIYLFSSLWAFCLIINVGQAAPLSISSQLSMSTAQPTSDLESKTQSNSNPDKPADSLTDSGQTLAACPNSPNCVQSIDTTDTDHYIEPLPLVTSPASAIQTVVQIIQQMPRTTVVTQTDHYLKAEFTSLIFRFVDDVEVLLDPASQQFHIRSASRTGYGDFGVNRKRVEAIRSELLKQQ